MEYGNVIILDVRTLQEFEEGHIDGAILIPIDEIEQLAPEMIPDKSQTILVYCRVGNRSNRAALILAQMGFTAVYDFGGINSWPYETRPVL